MIFSFWLQLTFRQRPLEKVVSTWSFFPDSFTRYWEWANGWFAKIFRGKLLFFQEFLRRWEDSRFLLLFFSSKIWLSCLFWNKDKDTTKTMQKEVNVTRLFGLRPYEIHWLIIFGGWLGKLVPQWLCWCKFSWGTFWGEGSPGCVLFDCFLGSCLCVEWRFFGRKSLTPTKSLMRIREAYGKKTPIFRLQEMHFVLGWGWKKKYFMFFRSSSSLNRNFWFSLLRVFFLKKSGFCCG